MESTRIVMFGPSLETRGGISAVVNVYRQEGLFARWNVEYISTYEGASTLAKIKAAATGFARYASLLGTGRVSLVHVHSASRWSFIRKSLFILPALALKKPVIFHLHGGEFIDVYQKLGAVGRSYIRFIVGHCARVVVLSPRWKEMLRTVTPAAVISVIMNPIDTSESAGRPIERTVSMLLFLGRLETKKGVYVLLEAVSRLKNSRNVRLLVGGEGDLSGVKQRMTELDINSRVELLGWVDSARKSELLAAATAFVLPSFAEGLPMSMLEAMSHGTAVITTPVGGIPDVLDDGVEGILVPPGDAEKLAAAIDYLLENPNIAREMGARGRQKFREHFSSEVIIPKIESLYSELGMQRHA